MSTDILFWIGGALLGLLGLTLLTWALIGDRSKGRRRCPKCWYDLSKTQGLRCSECGREARSEKKLFKSRQRWRWAAVSLFVLLIAGCVAVQPKVQRDGWASVMPTSVLLCALQAGGNEWVFDELETRVHMRNGETGLWNWQWRWIGTVCSTRFQNDTSPAGRKTMVPWIAFASESLPVDEDDPLRHALRAALVDPDPRVRMSAAIYYPDARFETETVMAVAPLLHDQNPMVRMGAVSGFRRFGMESLASNPLLMNTLRHHDDAEIRASAASALASIAEFNEEPKGAFEELEMSLACDPDLNVRLRSLRGMTRFCLTDPAL